VPGILWWKNSSCSQESHSLGVKIKSTYKEPFTVPSGSSMSKLNTCPHDGLDYPFQNFIQEVIRVLEDN
jgi:hypothetical protein